MQRTLLEIRPLWLLAGIAFACVALNSGCEMTRPKVIVEDAENIPMYLRHGQPAPFDGWLLSVPLFNSVEDQLEVDLNNREQGRSNEIRD